LIYFKKRYIIITKWTVTTTKAVDKQTFKLSKKILFILRLLFEDLANKGPVLPDWPNYSKLNGKKNEDKRHLSFAKR
jgi:hypothetical protein